MKHDGKALHPHDLCIFVGECELLNCCKNLLRHQIAINFIKKKLPQCKHVDNRKKKMISVMWMYHKTNSRGSQNQSNTKWENSLAITQKWTLKINNSNFQNAESIRNIFMIEFWNSKIDFRVVIPLYMVLGKQYSAESVAIIITIQNISHHQSA